MAAQPKQERMPHEIRSPSNPLIKVFRRALAEGITRDGLLAVEGPFVVEEALRAGRAATIRSVIVSEDGLARLKELVTHLPADVEIARVPDRLFHDVAQTEAPQGIAALVELHRHSLESVLHVKDALLVVVCGLQDPGNLGTILRSAQAFGAAALIALEGTVSPFNPKAMRASAGAVFHVPTYVGEKLDGVVKKLQGARVRLVAADRHSPMRISDCDLRGSLAILIGQEAAGLPPEIARLANVLLSIPIREGMDSLNAATAASIFLYEAARQRAFKH